MASFSFARPAQPTASQSNHGALSFGTSRSANGAGSNDPLQPLRTMADRVGKEVEKFAERVDHWHTHGNESDRAKYQTTVKMIGKFRDVAETQVKELKRAHAAEHKREQERSTRRRIQDMAEAPDANATSTFGHTAKSSVLSFDAKEDSKSLQNLQQWQAELATWELVRIIIDRHYHEPGTDVAAEKQTRLSKVGGNKRYSPNNEIWDRFLVEDDQAKEKAVILRWLEQTARNDRSDIGSISAQLESQSGKGELIWTNGWLDTKSKIKQAKRLEGSDQPLQPDSITIKSADRTQNLVTQLDPDAPTRQKRVLEKQDEFFERALWMECYEMLRRGTPWNNICEWAQDRNEAWRGVSVGAAYEAHPDGGPNVAGPTVGYLFRRMCFYAARGARIPYEGAVYGLLSGDLKQVQIACHTWDDHLHAHYNALLLSRFDRYLQQNYPDRVNANLAQKFVFQDAAANIGDWDTASRKVVVLLKQQKSIASEATNPIKLIQGALIGRTMDDLVLKVGTAIADLLVKDERPVNLILHPDSSTTDPGPRPVGDERVYTAEQYYQTLASDPHAFRILVHIFIAFKTGFHEFGTTDMSRWVAIDNLIAAYIEFLRVSQRIQLIPLYAAQLLAERAAHCLARVLPDIKNSEEQRRCVALLEQYRIDVVEVVAQSFTFAFDNSGFTYFDPEGATRITKPITRFKILEKVAGESALWPGYKVQREFEGEAIEPKEEAIIEALQWYHYVGNDYRQTFDHLCNALTIFLLNGRLGAAEKVVNDLSVEALSLSRTEALCGYPFDFTQPGSEEQDEATLHDHRKALSPAALRTAIPFDSLPTAEKHAAIVHRLREKSSSYYDLQQIVRILVLFREWRHEEDIIVQFRNDQSRVPASTADASTKRKADMSHIKDLLETIEAIFSALITSITSAIQANPILETSEDSWRLKLAFIPEIVLGYLSILHTAAFFVKRDSAVSSAVKAMEIANLVADEENEWLQHVFLETGRMSELVDALASVSKAVLRLGEHEPRKKVAKRGGRGETLRIWDLGVGNRG
ncbi:107-domain-containing protein [Paraphoma chrysanthemicola]|nr:107-domain-containing protein [Paraphoma chrysanthemicola]